MGFTSVYKTLTEVFPQIDSRVLRAVAIEHPKDADVAVEVVLVEVIPHLSEQSLGSSSKAESSIGLSEDNVKNAQHKVAIDPVLSSFSRLLNKAGSSDTDGRLPGLTEVLDAGSSGQTNHATVIEPIYSGSLGISSYHDTIGESDTVSDGLPTTLEKCEDNSNINPDSASSATICERGSSYDNNDQRCVEIGGDNIASLGESVVTDAGLSGSIQEEVALQLDVITPAAKEKCFRMYVDTEMVISPASSQLLGVRDVTHEPDLNSSLKTMSEKDASVGELVNSEDESIMTSTLTRSACSTELLEDIIEEARNSKKTLVSTMDSVVNLMKEVEFNEKAAEQAKVDADRGCSDVLSKVEDLKEALRRAKEANDMHAGEVYAEKAILATELKELQLRLFTLSDERDISLGILEEMRKALEIRLATALEEIKAAEAEKMEKEKFAREALAYQESQMEKVVEESKKLKLEAEENSKLQDFLMDRGRAIDILQGEISVKCQDVRLLKEKFDKRIPLSRSLSSSQTSSILASSGSSFRSTVTPYEPEPEPETYETPKASAEVADSYGFLEKSSRSELASYEFLKTSSRSLSPKSPKETIYSINDSFPSGEQKHDDGHKLHLDDDWELFNKDDLRLDA